MIAGLLAADHLFSYPRWPLTTSTLCSRQMGCVDSALGSAHGGAWQARPATGRKEKAIRIVERENTPYSPTTGGSAKGRNCIQRHGPGSGPGKLCPAGVAARHLPTLDAVATRGARPSSRSAEAMLRKCAGGQSRLLQAIREIYIRSINCVKCINDKSKIES